VGKLFVASLRMIYRNKQGLFWSLAFPIIFVVVFGLFDFEQAPESKVRLVAAEPSQLSQSLQAALEQVESFTVTVSTDEAASKEELAAGDLDVVVIVPPSTGEAGGGALEVVYGSGNPIVKEFTLSALQQVIDSMNLQLAGVTEPPLSLELQPVSAQSTRYYDFLLPGLVAMGALTSSIIGMSIAIATYREQNIFKRILATPLRPVKFLVAQVGARLVLSVFQTALILGMGILVFGANVEGVGWLFVLAAFGNLIFLIMGIVVAGRAPNANTAASIANAVTFPMMFLSGTFFDTSTLPSWLAEIVRFLPLTPLIEAMRAIAIEGESITDVGPQLLLLTVWALVLFALAARTFRFTGR
jgi:ABC-2 type transport system permease protein